MSNHCGAGCFPATTTFTPVTAAQAVIGDRQQGVGIRRQVDTNHLRLLIHDMVDKSRILVAESIVVLPPHGDVNR